MTDAEITFLKAAFVPGRTYWQHDRSDGPIQVLRIGAAAKPEEGDEPEPSECAYLVKGGYVALWNADLQQFTTQREIRATAPKYSLYRQMVESFETRWLKRPGALRTDLGLVAFKPGDNANGYRNIEYRNDHVQQHWETYQSAARDSQAIAEGLANDMRVNAEGALAMIDDRGHVYNSLVMISETAMVLMGADAPPALVENAEQPQG